MENVKTTLRRVLAHARKTRLEHPKEYKKFLELCQRYGTNGALNMCSISPDLHILIGWAALVIREKLAKP